MPNQATEFRQKLLDAQEMSPALRASYEEELDRMLHPTLTHRTASIGISLLVLLVVCTLALVRNMLVVDVGPLTLVGWAIMAAAFSYASYLIVRDLWQRKHSPKSVSSIAQALYLAAAAITVVALLIGLQKPSDPASTFNAFFVFVCYVACLAWTIESRIAASELAAREQMLRIEFRLADLADKLEQAKS
jgi:hypothetical protein